MTMDGERQTADGSPVRGWCRCSPVCQRCDHQARGVSQVLIGVEKLGITDVGEAVFGLVVPSMP